MAEFRRGQAGFLLFAFNNFWTDDGEATGAILGHSLSDVNRW